MTSLLWTMRFAAALGFASLTLTGEVSPAYIWLSWMTWALSFPLDRQPEWQKRVSRWENAAVGVLVSAFLIDFFHWGYSIFVSVAHFLLLFQIFKLLGLKTRKDALQILIFSFFQILSACTLSVDVWQALILLLLIPTAAAGLFWQQISRETENSGQTLPTEAARCYRRWVVGICLGAIPINLIFASVMFMLFPRLAFRGAFAGLGSGRSGYSEQVNLEESGTIGTDNSAVLWLQIIPPEDRARWKGYLRGGTLDVFDGKKWSHRPVAIAQTLYADRTGRFKIRNGYHGLRQTVTLVNTAGARLFGSPVIGEVSAPLATLQAMADGSVRWTSGWRKPMRYEVVSFDQALDSQRVPVAMSDYLQIPKSVALNRTQILVRQIATRHAPLAKAQAIERYLKSHYQYSLDQGPSLAENPLENFLFIRQRGPCGHFASAMAMMLRLEGIPSRIVAGYYKGSWNDRVGQYLMRERDAHAWVEAYIPEHGWMTFDPTPRTTAVSRGQKQWLRLKQYWEYLNYEWDRLVIEYDLYSQVKTLENFQSNTNRINARINGWIDTYLMGWKRPNTAPARDLAAPRSRVSFHRWGPMSLLLIVGLSALVWKIRKRSDPQDRAIVFYKNFLDQMARQGFPKAAFETGWEYAERLASQLGAEPVREITRRYYQIRFRGHPPR